MRLTVKERILLHLVAAERLGEGLEVPRTLTQEGIAEASWIRRRNLSQYIRPLMGEGLVTERRAHVRGIRQKRKVYGLTTSGKLKAVRLKEKVMAAIVRAGDENGTRELTVAQALSEAGDLATPLEIVRLAMQGEPINLNELEATKAPQFVSAMRDAPHVKNFVGRRRELRAVTGDTPDGGRVIVIRGVAGIGKSSLAAEACERLRGKRNLFWHRVRPWDTRDSILSRLGGFLSGLGKPGLQAVLKRGDADRAPDVFREDLSGTQSFLVFDDAHEADDEVLPFFRLLLEALAETSDARALILTRRALSFYSRRDVVLHGVVEELDLKGLESHDVATYLSEHEMPEPSYEVAQRLHGHPLFLELLRAHNPFSGALADVRRYLEEEVYTDLSDAERGMMKVASLYSVPVPREAFFADSEWPQDVFLSLGDRSLLRSVGESRYEVHDTIREFFVDLLTIAESQRLPAFAEGELRALADSAGEAEEFAACSGYLSNALRLSTVPARQAELWESLGDANLSLGDLLAVSVAYQAAARLASDAESAARAHRKMARAFVEWGDTKSAQDEVQAGFESLGDAESVERGWLLLARADTLVETTNVVRARENQETALSIFQDADDLRGQAEALLDLADTSVFFGTREGGRPPAEEYVMSVLQLAATLDDVELAVRAHLAMVGVIRHETGDVDAALEHFAAAETLAQGVKDVRIRIQFLADRAAFHTTFDADSMASAAYISELMRVGRQVHDDFSVAYAKYLLGTVETAKGNLDHARRAWEEAAEVMQRLGDSRFLGAILYLIGRCCLMQDDLEGFRRTRTILEAPETQKAGIWWVYPKVFRALVQLIKGDVDDSRTLFEDTLRELEKVPLESYAARFEMPRTHLIYGAVLRVMNKETEAEEHIRRARAIYQSGHMDGMLAEADVIEARLTEGLKSMAGASGPVSRDREA